MHTLCCNVHLCKRSCLQEKGPKRTVRPSTTECNQPLVSIPVKAGRLTDAMTTAMSSLTHTRERTMCSYQCSKLQRVEIVKAVILLIPHFSTHVSYVFPYFETLGDFRQSDFEARSQTALSNSSIRWWDSSGNEKPWNPCLRDSRVFTTRWWPHEPNPEAQLRKACSVYLELKTQNFEPLEEAEMKRFPNCSMKSTPNLEALVSDTRGLGRTAPL